MSKPVCTCGQVVAFVFDPAGRDLQEEYIKTGHILCDSCYAKAKSSEPSNGEGRG